ncbi:MAG TPA: porphobilinogen synthase, partial [Gemmatimonadetes bacterium]|nr:porphobilinogen synthase [Gemmatimonadota bacterium]
MSFPRLRLRRLRRGGTWRRVVRETSLSTDDLVYPLFVVGGEAVRNPVASMPGVFQLSVDLIVEEAREVHALGISAVILFGVPDEGEKDAEGSAGYDPEGLVPTAIRAIREAVPDLLVWADVCLCEYTDHGHCGLLTEEGEVDGDSSLPLLARAALVYAEAGADAVAPSDMMDGRV